jgi:hypothetical protein
VDGPDGGSLAFDNMQDRGPTGTTDWAAYAIELDVPAEAVNINFGVIMPGRGTAWFDGLTVEIDGAPWSHEHYELDFEGERIRGVMPMNPAFPARLDRDVVRSGKQSLRLDSAPAPPANAVLPKAALDACQEVLDHLEASRDRFWEAAGPERTEWAIQNARVVVQCLQMRAGGGGLVRDRSMAENVSWILARDPEAKIVLWAHNGHVARQPGTLGHHLSQRYGDDYLVVGFATGEGAYFAVGDGGLGEHPLLPPPAGSVEQRLRAIGEPRLILDVRAAGADDPASAWLTGTMPFRSIGALAMDQQFFPANVQQLYDLVIYIDRTSASVPIQR